MIQEVQDALRAQLLTVTDLPPLQGENELYIAKGAFVRFTTIYSRPSTLTVGANGKDLHQNFMHVDLLNPVNTGTEAINTLVESITAVFPRGLELEAGAHTVQVIKSFRETSTRLNDQYQMTVVRVEYRVIA